MITRISLTIFFGLLLLPGAGASSADPKPLRDGFKLVQAPQTGRAAAQRGSRDRVETGLALPAPAEALKLMRQVNDWQLAHPVMKPLNRNWERGTWYTGVMAVWKATGDKRFLDQACKWGQLHHWQVGQERNGANNLFCVQTWLETYFVKPDPAMTSPTLHWLATTAPFAPANAEQWNVAGDKRIYSDSLYGACALAMLSRATGDPQHLKTMHEFFWSVTGKLFDKDEGLYYRDMSYIGKRTAGGGKILWSRGNGWVFGGIARLLDYLPPQDPQRPRYVSLMQTMAAALAKRQGEDGLWRPNLGDPAELPMPETSGTGFFCYGMAWGINHGILEREIYLPVVQKAWAGLRRAVSPEGKVLWGQQVDAMPHAVRQESTHEYVTGTFLLAASEVYKLAGGVPAGSPQNQ